MLGDNDQSIRAMAVDKILQIRIENSQQEGERLEQTWATYGPRAGSGPRDHFTRPAGTYKNVTLYRESSRTSFTLL